MHTIDASDVEISDLIFLNFSMRLQSVVIVVNDRLGREMECKWKLVMTNQNSVASAGLDSA